MLDQIILDFLQSGTKLIYKFTLQKLRGLGRFYCGFCNIYTALNDEAAIGFYSMGFLEIINPPSKQFYVLRPIPYRSSR